MVFKTGTNSLCLLFICDTFLKDNETHFLKGCLDYGQEPTDFIKAWPEDQDCVVFTDGELKGIPSGHGCKCSEDNCNFDICSAANSNKNSERNISIEDNEEEGKNKECRTINCQKCVFPFRYGGKEYNECITVDSDNGAPWCAVQVNIEFK